MKQKTQIKLLTFIICLICSQILKSQSNYVKGFETGFKSGYCYNESYNCIPPVTPIAPIPSADESYNDFWAGYNRGFLQGFTKNSSTSNTGPYGNAGYIPKINQFTPDYSFYYNSLKRTTTQTNDNVNSNSSSIEYLIEELNDPNQQSIRYGYINFILQRWQQNNSDAPSNLPNGNYKVMIANYDNTSYIGGKLSSFSIGKVTIENSFIVWFGEEYSSVTKTVIAQKNIWHINKFPPSVYVRNNDDVSIVIKSSSSYTNGYCIIEYGYVNNYGKYVFSFEKQIVFFLDYI